MKVKAENLQFLKSFDKVKVNDPYSIGSAVQVIANGKEAVFTIVADTVLMRKKIELEGESDFSAIYPVKDLFSYVNTLPRTSFIEFDEKGIKVSGKSSRYNLKSKDIETYDFDSYLPEDDVQTEISIPKLEMKVLNLVRPFVGEEKFASVSIYKHDDGHYASLGNPSAGAILYKTDIQAEVHLPVKFIDVIKDTESDVAIKSYESNYFSTNVNGVEIYFINQTDVAFPDMNNEKYFYEPKGWVKVNAGELQNTIKRMALVAQEDKSNRVFFYADEEVLGLYVIDGGTSYDFIDFASTEGEPNGNSFSININNIAKHLAILSGDIEISFNDNSNSLIMIRNSEMPDLKMALPGIMDYGDFNIEEVKKEV